MAKRNPKDRTHLIVRALRTRQSQGINVFAFFMPGGDITKIAEISRIERGEDDVLKGFQRREIREHVRSIVNYLNQDRVLFPNAIILAMTPDIRFTQARGPKPSGLTDNAEAGTLVIPMRREGERIAWIVDGQQRSIALSQCDNPALNVPVIAFVTDDLQVQREQFILVNKARPLPTRLINELLPETGSVVLPRDLASRKIPSELCGALGRDSSSPFFGLIKRLSESDKKKQAVITDTAVLKMIRSSINSPLGALSPYKATNTDGPDLQSMYQTLCTYWSAVKKAFPDAWGLPPTKSRLMHSAGIEAMGVLMDRMYARHGGRPDEYGAILHDLERIAPSCHWTEGEWEGINLSWNEIQNTSRHIRGLTDTLVRLYAAKGRA